MNLKRDAAKAVFWSVIQTWGNRAGTLIIFFVLARLLEPAAFGLIALADVFITFMQIFMEQGFSQALIQRQDLDDRHSDTAFWTSVAIGLILCGLTWLGSGSIALFFKQPEMQPILQWFSLVFVINSFSGTQQALLERELEFKAIATRRLLATVIGGAIGIVVAFNGGGVWSIVVQRIVSDVVGVLVLWKVSQWRPKFRWSTQHFKDLFNFGVYLLGFNFLNFFNTRADDLLIGYFLGPVELGYYSVAYRILKIIIDLLVSTTSQVALPTFSRLQGNLEQLQRAFYTATRTTSLIAFPAFAGIVVLAPELITLLFGSQWQPSVPVLQILCLGGLLHSISYFKAAIFIAMGKPSWRLWLGVLNSSANVIGFAIAVNWGIIAVAIAYTVRFYIMFPITQWAVSRLIQIPFSVYIQQFTGTAISSVILTFLLVLLRNSLEDSVNPQTLIAISFFSGTLVYFGAVRLVAPRLFAQFVELLQLVLSRTRKPKAS